MDIKSALADIDAALNDPIMGQGGSAAVVEVSSRLCACIRRHAPPGSVWRQQGDRFIEYDPKLLGRGGSPQQALTGVLRSLRRDVERGMLAQFEELIHADVYADLLQQAEGLLRDKYARAATVVAGAALEEHLKRLAVKHNTGLTQPSGAPKKASQINNELKAAMLYTEVQRKLVEGWQGLRNDAAHGNPGFDGSDTSLVANIAPMTAGITAFIAQYPA